MINVGCAWYEFFSRLCLLSVDSFLSNSVHIHLLRSFSLFLLSSLWRNWWTIFAFDIIFIRLEVSRSSSLDTVNRGSSAPNMLHNKGRSYPFLVSLNLLVFSKKGFIRSTIVYSLIISLSLNFWIGLSWKGKFFFLIDGILKFCIKTFYRWVFIDYKL